MTFAKTDLGNAEHFAHIYKNKVIFDYREGWFVWDGSLWKRDENGQIQRFAQTIPRIKLKAANEMSAENEAQIGIRKGHVTWALQSENVNRLGAMIKLAGSQASLVADKDWDSDPWLLGTPNGTIDLRTGLHRPAKPSDRITKSVGVAFDSAALCPLWDKVMASFWPNDPAMSDFVQRGIGYSLTGSIKEQAFFCLHGQGNNGKSVLVSTIRHLMGDYGYTMPFSTLDFGTRSSISNDVAALAGRRFVMSSEAQEDARLNEGRIKGLTGDSTITARFLNKEYFTFQPVGKFWLAFNHRPRIVDSSHGMWRRIRLIEFSRIFTESEVIKDLEAMLVDELPGILNWAIEGCLKWQREGLEVTSAIKASTAEYRVESNGMFEFIEQVCDVGAQFAIPKQALYNAYVEWTGTVKERFPYSKHGFGSRMAAQGFQEDMKKIDGRPVRRWVGIGLSGPFDSYGETVTVKGVVQ